MALFVNGYLHTLLAMLPDGSTAFLAAAILLALIQYVVRFACDQTCDPLTRTKTGTGCTLQDPCSAHLQNRIDFVRVVDPQRPSCKGSYMG